MKKIINHKKTGFFKKRFIQLCRKLGYEIIDQNNLYIPTSEKFVSEELSKSGKKSINLPLGEVKITRSVLSLDIIIKTCTSINFAKQVMPNILFKIFVIDYNSNFDDLKIIEKKLTYSKIPYKIINLNISEFKNKIQIINQKNKKVQENMLATMSSIYKSFLLAKESCNDLVYFVEDDYIHQKEAISEMLFTYERISSQIQKELVICPSDYPFLYNKVEKTQIYLGNKRHWRTTGETLLTFMISKKLIKKHWNAFENMCQFENSPFEKPLHKIYEHELCLSPIPSLVMHCTNINSIYGIPPNFEWKKIWDENKI